MKKSLLYIILGLLLIGGVVYGVWFLNKQGKMTGNTRDTFVPDNSALVVNMTSKAILPSKFENLFRSEIDLFRLKLLHKSADTLRDRTGITQGYTLAIRTEGKMKLSFLYLLENREFMSRNEISHFFKNIYKESQQRERKYEGHRIYELTIGKTPIYYAVNEGTIMLSDSELYIEDALKQFEGGENKSDYVRMEKYFSPASGINVFINKDFFSDILPFFWQTEKLHEKLDITKFFDWGAMDGEANENGFLFNGFMSSQKTDVSYMKTLQGQKPKEATLDRIIPSNVNSILSLNLTDLKSYLTELDNYQYSASLIDKVRKRKQEYKRFLGPDAETELKELLQGEFALVTTAFDANQKEHVGAIVVALKSGGLCKAWVEKLIAANAKYRNLHPDSYRKVYRVDREKSFDYFTFPVEDMASMYWGYIFENVKSRYVCIIDNYMILASSEQGVTDFIKAYMHNYTIKDMEWYKNAKNKLSVKYNLAYISNISREMPFYSSVSRGDLQKALSGKEDGMSVFSAFAMQWANETDMFYSILYLGTEDVNTDEKPHLLWQTKLEAPMTMKPVVVVNHTTGEREFIIQDEKNTLYLINNSGRILWKQAIEGKINSEIYQVDVFKNGKLQYLFSTPAKMYLIDRNGDPVNRFPISFRAECPVGISVYDYDQKKEYRIFAPCVDREVYLYDLDGKLVTGWKSGKTDKEIVSKVKFHRVNNRDYIIYADKYRLYIRDRKGNERVKVSAVFDLADETELYFSSQDGKPVIVFPNTTETVNFVDFSGSVKAIKCEELTSGSFFNISDIDRDGREDIVITSGNKLAVYNFSGKRIFLKDFKTGQLQFPYIYRFSGNDIRIGLLDKLQKKMILVNTGGGISKGFPIDGDSPFSIIFGQAGDFFLFAGTNGGNFIKYRVQR